MTGARAIPAGIVVWAAHFGMIYGFTGYACARSLGPAVPWVVAGATLAAAAVAAGLLARAWPRRAAFESWLAAAVAGAALAAIVLESIVLFWVAPCVSR